MNKYLRAALILIGSALIRMIQIFSAFQYHAFKISTVWALEGEAILSYLIFADPLSFQQRLESLFDVFIPFPQQFAHQAVRSGIGPIRTYLSSFQKIDDGSGVVNIRFVSKGKAIVPSFHICLFALRPLFI